MIGLDDIKWKQLHGGYRELYDASVPLKKLEQAKQKGEIKAIVEELWNNLHHQGDVDTASYYAIPHLIRIANDKDSFIPEILSLPITIEIERHRSNPPIPSELTADYYHAITQIGELGRSIINNSWDLVIASISLSAIAISKGQIELARAITLLEDQSTLDEFLETY